MINIILAGGLNFPRQRIKNSYCVCLFKSFLFLSRWGGTRVLSSECKTDLADVTDRICVLLSTLIEEISPNPEALRANTEIAETA